MNFISLKSYIKKKITAQFLLIDLKRRFMHNIKIAGNSCLGICDENKFENLG